MTDAELSDLYAKAKAATWRSAKTAHPKPHSRCLVRHNGVIHTATPCYGMHAPWWVVKTMCGESAPVPFHDDDEWCELIIDDPAAVRALIDENRALKKEIVRVEAAHTEFCRRICEEDKETLLKITAENERMRKALNPLNISDPWCVNCGRTFDSHRKSPPFQCFDGIPFDGNGLTFSPCASVASEKEKG